MMIIEEWLHYPKEHVKQATIQFRDIDGDGIQEILATWLEGHDYFTLQPGASQSDISHVTFTLTAVVVDGLRQAGLPEDALQALHPLLDREFLSKQTFLQAVEQQLGTDALAQYGELIVQTAIGPYQLQQP
jgi:hypothetical protein